VGPALTTGDDPSGPAEQGVLEPDTCAYLLDEEFRIAELGDGWSLFARANDAPELASDATIGRSVLACVSDSTSAHLYRRLFEHVLRTGRPVSFPIRCDSPAKRRLLEVRIEKRQPSGLLIQTRLIRSEARPPVGVLDRRAPRNPELLRMCGWCKAVDVDGRWCEVEEAVVSKRLFARDLPPAVTHGICPTCHRRVSDLLDEKGL